MKINKFTNYIKENSSFEDLNFTVDVDVFKERGYTYQELYANDYPVYHKDIMKGKKLWCWLDRKTIEFDDFHSLTKNVIEYYIENCDDKSKVKHSDMFNYDYIPIYLNIKTGEIKHKYDVVRNIKGVKDLEEFMNSEYEVGDDWQKITLTDSYIDVINEINILTNNKYPEFNTKMVSKKYNL